MSQVLASLNVAQPLRPDLGAAQQGRATAAETSHDPIFPLNCPSEIKADVALHADSHRAIHLRPPHCIEFGRRMNQCLGWDASAQRTRAAQAIRERCGHGEGWSSGGREVFATNLRLRRAELGLSQEALAHNAGLHRTFIGAVERSESNVSLDNIEKLAKAVGNAPWELLKPR